MLTNAKYVKFERGNVDSFKHLKHKNEDTLYFVYDEDENIAELYLGDRLIAAASSNPNGVSELAQLLDVNINEPKLSDLLVYNPIGQIWENKSIEDIMPIFIGTNGVSNGRAGAVPAPTAAQSNTFLRSDGQWVNITTSNRQFNLLVADKEEDVSDEEYIDKITENISIAFGDIIIIRENSFPISYIYNGAQWINIALSQSDIKSILSESAIPLEDLNDILQ